MIGRNFRDNSVPRDQETLNKRTQQLSFPLHDETLTNTIQKTDKPGRENDFYEESSLLHSEKAEAIRKNCTSSIDKFHKTYRHSV